MTTPAAHQQTYESLLLKENHQLREQLEQLSRKLQDLMDSNYADKRNQISELQSLKDLVKRQTDQIAMLKEQLRDATNEERGDYHQRRELVKEVQVKNAEIEEIKKKAKTRKEKCRILKRENATLKNALREVEIRSSSGNVHQ